MKTLRLLLVFCAAVLIPAAASGSKSAPLGFQVGDTLPDRVFYDETGNASQFSDFRGKVLVAVFFADWCPPCWSKLPDLRTLHQALRDEPGVAFIIVGHREREAVTRQALKTEARAIPVYHTRESSKTRRVEWEGIDTRLATSETFMLDHRGVILFKASESRDRLADQAPTLPVGRPRPVRDG